MSPPPSPTARRSTTAFGGCARRWPRGEATRADLVRSSPRWRAPHALDRVSAKLERKLERAAAQAARREARRLRRLEDGGHDDRTRGVLGAVAAFVLLLLAVTTPNWWLVFVAMGVGMPAARALISSSRDDARAARREDAGAPGVDGRGAGGDHSRARAHRRAPEAHRRGRGEAASRS